MTTTPAQRLETEIRAAMKGSEKERLSTLRLLLAEVRKVQLDQGADLDEAGFLVVVRRAIKQRQDSVAQYTAAGRSELAAREQAEIALLETYLPRQADEAEIRAAIAELVAAQGLAGPSAIGTVMKAMLARFAGAADGATINRLAREALAPPR